MAASKAAVNPTRFPSTPGPNNALFTKKDSPVVAIIATDFMRIGIFIALTGAAAFGLAAWVIAPVDGRGTDAAPESTAVVQESVAPAWSPKKQSAVSLPPPATDASPRERVSAAFEAAVFNPNMTMPLVASMPVNATPPTESVPEPTPHKSNKPFRCPRGTGQDGDGLTVAEIAQIKSVLNLTKAQEVHWRPVETALTEMAKRLAEGRANGRKVVIPPERTQAIYFSAGPLVRSLNETQKRDIRNLACTMGLGAVAALI